MNITIQIPFLSWSDKPALSVEIDATIEARFHMRAAVTQAVSNGANLYGANLQCANLQCANLQRANLQRANLQRANLQRANLYGANLQCANLYGANLQCATLEDANLQRANLQCANLEDANLQRANLYGANLEDAKNLSDLAAARLSIVPDGALGGWKKCKDGVLVHLLIPHDAKRSNAAGRKCRAEFAEVLGVYGAEVGISQHDNSTAYRVGEVIHCDSWCADRFKECAGGIHFYLTRVEAENH